MRVPDMVGDENNEHAGLVMVHMTKDEDIEGLSVVDTAIDPNLGGEMYHICERRKGICDVWTLIQVNDVNDEYLKVMFELLAQSRGLIRQREVAKAFSWNSRTPFQRWRRLGLIAPFCMTGRRQQEVSLMVKAAAEAVPLGSVCPSRAGEIDEECGGDGGEAPGQPESDSLVSDWAGMLKSSADRETVVAGVRNLAGELNQARKEVAGEARRREVIPRHLMADRLARADGLAC
jgi:hypothetical protein